MSTVIEDFEVLASRVALLPEGLMVMVTAPEPYYSLLHAEECPEITVIPSPGVVYLQVGRVLISLKDEVLDHVAERGQVLVFLSNYDDYVMKPWVTARIHPSDLWTVKGVATFLADHPRLVAMEPVPGPVPEEGVARVAAATEICQDAEKVEGSAAEDNDRPFNAVVHQ